MSTHESPEDDSNGDRICPGVGSVATMTTLRRSRKTPGNSYIAGTYRNTIPVGDVRLLEVLNAESIYVASSDPTGEVEWAEHTFGTHSGRNDAVTGMVVSDDGSVYLTGHYDNPTNFGSIHLENDQGGSQTSFVAKLSQQGRWEWATSADSSSETWDRFFDISIVDDGLIMAGDCYGGTNYHGDIQLDCPESAYGATVAKISLDGEWIWASVADGGNGCSAYGVATDFEGDAMITGKFSENCIFGTTTLDSGGNNMDVFVAKLDGESGDWLWAERAGSDSKGDIGYDVDIDNSGNGFVTGYFDGSADFGIPPNKSAHTRPLRGEDIPLGSLGLGNKHEALRLTAKESPWTLLHRVGACGR